MEPSWRSSSSAVSLMFFSYVLKMSYALRIVTWLLSCRRMFWFQRFSNPAKLFFVLSISKKKLNQLSSLFRRILLSFGAKLEIATFNKCRIHSLWIKCLSFTKIDHAKWKIIFMVVEISKLIIIYRFVRVLRTIFLAVFAYRVQIFGSLSSPPTHFISIYILFSIPSYKSHYA
jgi:hypothetical protein